MDFGETLTKAWKIIWKFKVLWIFGILTSCGQGGGGGGSGNSGYQFSSGEGNVPPEMRHFFFGLVNFFDKLSDWQIAGVIIGVLLLILVLIFIFTALGTIGRLGLIQGTVKAEEGVESMRFGELFQSGKPFFWRIFGFNLLAGLAVGLIVFLLLLPFIGIAALTMGIGVICLIPVICILVPLGWLVEVVLEQAYIAIVVEDLNMVEGLKRGWTVFRENIGNMIVMALILVLGGGIVGVIIALPVIFTMLPLMIGAIAAASGDSSAFAGGGAIVSALCCASYLPVLIVLSGILQAYIKSAWTLTYLRLTSIKGAKAAMEEPMPEEDL